MVAYFYYRFKNGLDLFWHQGLYFHEEYVKHRKWLDEKNRCRFSGFLSVFVSVLSAVKLAALSIQCAAASFYKKGNGKNPFLRRVYSK
ncbi:MAG TPA: hypothetical protein VEY68_12540 [Anoxybacillus sp.]|nr:hypothetical protein [Anoxybacillus sp.]